MTPSADFTTLGDGRALLLGTTARLVRWLDDRFLQMAREGGAVECRFPAAISNDVLTRAGYFEAHPDGATALGGSAASYSLPPAVCYHAYAMLAGTRLEAPMRLTASQTCFREADRPALTSDRLWEFTMREAIFIGPAEWVSAERTRWAERIDAFARDLRLSASRVPATDPFFAGAGRGRHLIQQLKGLKQELRMSVGSDTIAVASFNLHERFFGTRFDITLQEGIAAHSGCAAFGLERWALAYIHQNGSAAADALVGT
jgi:seryl-tRNA synthetase